jgi:predicted dehydrogenase
VLIEDSNLDAVYVPLPPSFHCEWSIKALEAGKHVLCEKPLACTPEEAIRMRDAARANDRVLMEGFHYRYHPLFPRVREYLERGELGKIRRIDASIKVYLPDLEDIRFKPQLGGGALLDVGCYTINMVRFLLNAEPTVLTAGARRLPSGVDTDSQAPLAFPDGSEGSIHCSLRAKPWEWRLTVRVEGTRGTLNVINPLLPHIFNWLSVRQGNNTIWRGRVPGDSTYRGQLDSFVGAINRREPFTTTADDAILNLKVLHKIQELSA